MKKQVTLSALALTVAAAHGCAEPSTDTPELDVGGKSSAIIGGVAANSAKLNAVGTLGVIESYVDDWSGERIESFFPFCTASLIAPHTIVTAKHCVLDIPYIYQSGQKAGFGIGPDGWNPSKVVEIAEVKPVPGYEGGIVDLGHDVAVVHLTESVQGITPLKYAQLTKASVGQRFGAIGYGVKDAYSNRGPRLAGNVTLNALEGKWF
jgi:hypothetical protein